MVVAGHLPEPRYLASAHRAGQLVALQKFCLLMTQLSAHPKVHVAYERAAWVSPESNAVRVTIDQNLRGEAVQELRLRTRMAKPIFPFAGKLILELKFTNRFPDWFRDMVQHLNLIQTGVPKYCGSVADIGEERLGAPAAEASAARFAEVAKYY